MSKASSATSTSSGRATWTGTSTFDQLKRDYPAVELAAVNQCSGNRRGLFDPHVAGVEWGVGAMGNARWKGARLKDVLAKVGLKKDALEIVPVDHIDEVLPRALTAPIQPIEWTDPDEHAAEPPVHTPSETGTAIRH